MSLWDRGPQWRGEVGGGRGKARRSFVGSTGEAGPIKARGGEKEGEGQMGREEGVRSGMEGQMGGPMDGWLDGRMQEQSDKQVEIYWEGRRKRGME